MVVLRSAARPRAPRNRLARAVRYLGLFAWFGGTARVLAAGGSIAAQGYLAEQQTPSRSVRKLRAAPR